MRLPDATSWSLGTGDMIANKAIGVMPKYGAKKGRPGAPCEAMLLAMKKGISCGWP